MRILHTADWHLNNKLGRIKRQPDIALRLEEIANYLDEHRVDVMVIAGDVFSQYTRLQQVEEAMADVRQIFTPFLRAGGTIIAVSGNHDNTALFNSLISALDLASPLSSEQMRPCPCGRLYLSSHPTCLRLSDKAGVEVQFGLLPYPTSARYLRDQATHYTNREEMSRSLKAAVLSELDKMNNEKQSHLPSVLVAHANVRGREAHNLYMTSEDVVFTVEELAQGWDYVALGHIHKPQYLTELLHVRYAGSVERFAYGEAPDNKSVTLIEMDQSGLVGEPLILPLAATPIYRIEILDPQVGLPLMKERYPDADRALVYYNLTYQPGRDNRVEVCRQLDRIFPHRYGREIHIKGHSSAQARWPEHLTPSSASRDVLGTVRTYLSEQMGDDPDLADLLSFAERLYAEREVAG